jgi:UDP-N-acetylmuramyl tripeptide synthase
MGQAAGRLADVVLVTSDNPRSEEPAAILDQIETGLAGTFLPRQRAEAILTRPAGRGYDVIESRRQAIGMAVRHAGPGDIVLISGKGHEDYQITRSGRHHFQDREEAQQQLCVINW